MLIVVSLLAACGSGEGVSERLPRSPVAFAAQISINEVMVAQIDDASYFIREAANPEIEVRWQEVEHRAVALIASGSAMTMGGAGVNDAMWVTQPGWRDFVGKMNAASVQALNAARDGNLIALGSAGDNLVGACESCHPQYKSSIPSVPTEG
jgi:cytochrome c556